MKVFTVDELIAELKAAAAASPSGGETIVCIDDLERSMGADGPVQSLAVAYDEDADRVTVFCDLYESC